MDWVQKVRMQGRIQKWVDHSISVTINLPNDVSEEMIDKLYVEAWRSGCKGCTVYRDGSRSGVLLSTEKKKKKHEDCMELELFGSENTVAGVAEARQNISVVVQALIERSRIDIHVGMISLHTPY